jgi:hypothetical protein
MYVSNKSVTGTSQPGATSPAGSVPRGSTAQNGTPETSAAAAADQAKLSASGQLMSKVSQLEQVDPEQFKGKVSQLAAELRQASAQESGLGAKMMAQLAGKLDEVVEGGTRAALAAAGRRGPNESGPEGLGPSGAPSASGRAESVSNPGALREAAAAAPRTAGTATPARAAAAYRANAPEPGSDGDGARAALAKVLDQLDAALKATGS